VRKGEKGLVYIVEILTGKGGKWRKRQATYCLGNRIRLVDDRYAVRNKQNDNRNLIVLCVYRLLSGRRH
jgi:hypothetical protein